MTAQNIRGLGKITDDRDRLVAFAISMQNTLTYNDRLAELGLPTIERVYFGRMSGDNAEDRKNLGIIRLSPTKSGKVLLATVRTFESWINSRRKYDFAIWKIRVLEGLKEIFERVYDEDVEYDAFLALADIQKELHLDVPLS
jgi:hypothetical protein